MARYNVHAGHCPQGKGASGAVGLLQESVEDRKVKNRVIADLEAAGHTVYDCTCEESTTQNGCLQKIVTKCNANSVDLDISIHLNAGGGSGVEVWCYDEKTKDIAAKICTNISTTLGITNRGVKYSQSLYVLKKTKAPAILIECAFVDSQTDFNRWDADKCGDAIAAAIASNCVTAQKPSENTESDKNTESKPTGNDWVRRLQTECNKQGFSNQTVDGIAGPKTLAGCPTCKKGSKGNITKLLQERLNALGFNCGNVDGIFGSGTKNAMIAFQKSKGLSADGIVGQKTWKALLGL